jgi:predicted nucleic acid-binding protein
VRSSPAHDCWLTLQSISEFYAAVTGKRIVPEATAAAQAADWLDLFPCAAATPNAVRAALQLASQRPLSYWDALLIATAAEAGCSIILTEDMADGAVIGGVRVYNPFAGDGLTDLTRQLLLDI